MTLEEDLRRRLVRFCAAAAFLLLTAMLMLGGLAAGLRAQAQARAARGRLVQR